MKAIAKWSVLGALALGLAATGCVSGVRAYSLAAFRSGCDPKEIKLFSQKGHDAVLAVCGTHEDWHFSKLNGWQYVGPSANQPFVAPVDQDGDGIVDVVDACVAVPGVPDADPKKNGCPPPPPPDQDKDGFLDSADACPTQVGTAPDGCPDTDGDGVKDAVDQCPKDPGNLPDGCPDGDGDTVADKDDACPTVAGSRSVNPAKNGCPIAVLSAKEILINETIEFQVGLATLLPSSDEIIAGVVAIMRDNDDVELIEVQGHTDDTGSRGGNRTLSQARAAAVLEVMISKGIAKERLVAKGYGQGTPLVNEKTDEARAKNRRVQFVILKRDKAKAKAKLVAREAAKDASAAKAVEPTKAVEPAKAVEPTKAVEPAKAVEPVKP